MNDIAHDLRASADGRSAPPRTRGRRFALLAIGLCLLAPILYFVHKGTRATPEKAGATAGPGAGAARVIPVVVAPAEKRDVPVYLDGLGSVLPLASVTLHTQVEGRLERVFFTEGQAVKRGQAIAQIDARPFAAQLHQMQATLARDSATLQNARVNLERYVALAEQKLIAAQQADDQRALVAQSEASVQQDKAQLESARLQVEYARLVSPIDGVTGVRQVDPGNIVHVNDPAGVVLITQLDPIAIVFTLPEDELPRVQKELARGPLAVDAFARDGSTKLATGTLALIDNQIDPTTATIKLKARFDNKDHTLWPNQFVKARLLLTTVRGALTVPASAIQRGPQGTFVYVAGDDNKVSMKPVEVAQIEGDNALLTRGVELGERVVIDGQNQLRPGSKVIARSANQSGSTAKPSAAKRNRPRNAGAP